MRYLAKFWLILIKRTSLCFISLNLCACVGINAPHPAPPDSIPHHHNKPSHSARTNSTLVCKNPASYAGQQVGDGHCVSLIKLCANAPNTNFWRPGEKVQGRHQLAPGTVIATFKNKRYPNRSGYHAAIYIGQDEQGIWVWDQWLGMPVHQRLIRYRKDQASASNSAQDYRVVKLVP